MSLAETLSFEPRADLHEVILLSKTIENAGCHSLTRVWRLGEHVHRGLTSLVPRLCVCDWRADLVVCPGVRLDGTVEFIDAHRTTEVKTDFLLPMNVTPGEKGEQGWTTVAPPIPAEFIPEDGDGRVLLFEVFKWAWGGLPRSGLVDPMLLRSLGGDSYEVEASW